MIPETAEPNVPVQFDASASADRESKKLTALWKFSDGTSLSGMKVSKTFAQPGLVTVTVTVNDGSGFGNAEQLAQGTILVNNQPIIVTKNLIRTNSRRLLLDASASYDIDGDALQYDWTLPDGSHNAKSSFYWEAPAGGVHFISLTVDDGRGKTNSRVRESVKILVNRAPVAVVDSVVYGCTGRVILFNGSLSYDPDGDPLTTRWDFKDGATTQETNPVHVFDKPGYYPVQIALDDGFADAPTIATIPVIIEGSPLAVMNIGDTTVCINAPIAFSGEKSTDPNGPLASYTWEFGDGVSATGTTVSHSYTKAGVYRATLTVFGNGSGRCSKTSQVTSTIRVVEGPVADFSIPECVSAGETVVLDASPSKPNGTISGIVWDVRPAAGVFARTEPKTSLAIGVPGLYDVFLTISVHSTSNCNTSTVSKKIRVNAPPELVWSVPDEIANGDPLVGDASHSRDPDGIIVEYRWTIDGAPAGTTPAISALRLVPGMHTVALTLMDNSGTSTRFATLTKKVRVNAKPNPAFVLPGIIYQNELVTLGAASATDADGDQLAFVWKIDEHIVSSDTVRLTAGRHTIMLSADDHRGVRNSTDSVQREIAVVAVPALAVSHPHDWIIRTVMNARAFSTNNSVGFMDEKNIVQSKVCTTRGATVEHLGWKPKNEILLTGEFAIVVWDSLRYETKPEPIVMTWNPSNPTIPLSAPRVNRPADRNVQFVWKKGSVTIGVGKLVEAPLVKGKNVFTCQALDQEMEGAHMVEMEMFVICE